MSISIGVSLGAPAQSFRNQPIPNTRLAIYVLAIRGPQAPYPLITSYIFPISPENLHKPSNFMTNYYNVAGSAQQLGIRREVDQYGQEPVSYMIEGTTGWQLHGTDGMTLTGTQSIQSLQAILNQFASSNTQQVLSGNANLYLMEIYDYFNQEYWQVVPIGEQVIRQDARRPLYQSYSLKFLGIQKVSNPPPPPPDVIAQSFAIGGGQATSSLIAQIGNTNGVYIGVTIPVT